MNRLPAHVDIREVGPRDGFQNEPETIATTDKIDLINQSGPDRAASHRGCQFCAA